MNLLPSKFDEWNLKMMVIKSSSVHLYYRDTIGPFSIGQACYPPQANIAPENEPKPKRKVFLQV